VLNEIAQSTIRWKQSRMAHPQKRVGCIGPRGPLYNSAKTPEVFGRTTHPLNETSRNSFECNHLGEGAVSRFDRKVNRRHPARMSQSNLSRWRQHRNGYGSLQTLSVFVRLNALRRMCKSFIHRAIRPCRFFTKDLNGRPHGDIRTTGCPDAKCRMCPVNGRVSKHRIGDPNEKGSSHRAMFTAAVNTRWMCRRERQRSFQRLRLGNGV